MKTPPLRLTVLAKVAVSWLFCLDTLVASQIDESKLLRAIAEVESGTSGARVYRGVGAAGERSAWQITAAVWRRYTRASFQRASTEVYLPNLIAAAHLRMLRFKVSERFLPDTVRNLALAWNGGLSAARSGGTARQRDYAQRVEATYERLVAQR